MVTGLPHFTGPSNICEDCTISKQHQVSFPKGRVRRERQHLEIVYSDICEPINPILNGGKCYIIT